MSQQKPRQRGGRVLDKATPEQVMGVCVQLVVAGLVTMIFRV